jgi:hypothetical protein
MVTPYLYLAATRLCRSTKLPGTRLSSGVPARKESVVTSCLFCIIRILQIMQSLKIEEGILRTD